MMQWFCKRRLWFKIIAVITVILIVFVANAVRVHIKLANLKTALESQGEVVDIEKLVQKRNAENDDAIEQLDRYFGRLGLTPQGEQQIYRMELIKPGKGKISWKQDEFVSFDGKRYTWPYFFKNWKKKREYMEQIGPILAHTNLMRRLDYHNGFEFWSEYRTGRRSVDEPGWFKFAIVCQLRQNNLTGVFRDLCSYMRFIRLLGKECKLGSQYLYRWEFRHIISSLWESLQAEGWSDEQLAQIQNEMELFRFVSPMTEALPVERAIYIKIFAQFRHLKAYSENVIRALEPSNEYERIQPEPISGMSVLVNDFREIVNNFANGSIKNNITEVMDYSRLWRWRLYSSYSDEIFCLEASDYAIKQIRSITMDKPFCAAKKEFDDGYAKFEKKLTRKLFMSSHLIPSLKYIIEILSESETLRQLAITAIAIKRYQLRHNQLPTNLSQLVPGILSKQPMDPMDGKPLRYSVDTKRQMILYSVGTNGSDDNGDPSPREPDSQWKHICAGKDWVWPIPASKEEVDLANEKTENSRIKRYILTTVE